MTYTVLTLALTTLFLTFVTSYVILRVAVSERPFRNLLLLFVILTPPVALFAFIEALFVRPKPFKYSAELGKIEDEIERERVEIFGGKIIHPSFSQRWEMSYLYAVKKSAA